MESTSFEYQEDSTKRHSLEFLRRNLASFRFPTFFSSFWPCRWSADQVSRPESEAWQLVLAAVREDGQSLRQCSSWWRFFDAKLTKVCEKKLVTEILIFSGLIRKSQLSTFKWREDQHNFRPRSLNKIFLDRFLFIAWRNRASTMSNRHSDPICDKLFSPKKLPKNLSYLAYIATRIPWRISNAVLNGSALWCIKNR